MKKIMLNQCGYLPKQAKTVTFVSDGPVKFSVCKSDGEAVLEGVADRKIVNESADEINYTGSFSTLSEAGMYFIKAQGFGESDYFSVDENVYDDALTKSLYFFYLQRCGVALPEEDAGIYAHEACHTSVATVYNTDIKMEVSGGWHDAGDYGRYVAPAGMTVAQLLMAYKANAKIETECMNPADDTDMPAILQEIKVELEWMLKMQNGKGELHHKVTCNSFCGFVMPEYETDPLVVSPVSVTATADFAAACAMAVEIYEVFDAPFAEKLKKASIKAYDALVKMDMPGGFINPEGLVTGEYADKCDEDERYWAAAELYKAFGDERYRQDFEAIANRKIYHGYGWEDMGSYGNMAYITTSNPVDEDLKERICLAMVKKADELLELSENDGYGVSLKKSEYIWGSNLLVSNNGIMLCDAYALTGDKKYLNAATAQLDYLLGRNPMGISYLTGVGTDDVKRPHHRPSAYVGVAMPGMLSGGPCDWLGDDIARQLLKGAPPAKSLADMTGSYSTNEVTIYWNSSLVLLLANII